MSKKQIKRQIVQWLLTGWRSGQIITVTAPELAALLGVPHALAKRCLKELHRDGSLYRCDCCGSYSLADRLLR